MVDQWSCTGSGTVENLCVADVIWRCGRRGVRWWPRPQLWSRWRLYQSKGRRRESIGLHAVSRTGRTRAKWTHLRPLKSAPTILLIIILLCASCRPTRTRTSARLLLYTRSCRRATHDSRLSHFFQPVGSPSALHVVWHGVRQTRHSCAVRLQRRTRTRSSGMPGGQWRPDTVIGRQSCARTVPTVLCSNCVQCTHVWIQEDTCKNLAFEHVTSLGGRPEV